MKTLLFVVGLAAWLMGAAFGQQAGRSYAAPPPHDAARSADLHRLFEAYWDEYLALHPLTATITGDHRFDDQLGNDISDEHRARLRELYARYLQRLKAFADVALSPRDRLNRDVLVYDLELELADLSFDRHLLPVHQLGSLPLMLPLLGSGGGFHPFKTVRDYENFLGRMGEFATWVETALANMRRGIAQGIVQPKVVMAKVQPQLEAILVSDATQSIFYKPLTNFPASFSDVEKARLQKAYSEAIATRLLPQYRRLHAFIRDEYLPRCRETVGWSALPRGQEWYTALVRQFTSTDLSPEQIFELGKREVARLQGEMLALQKQTGFTGTLHEFAAYLERTDTNTFQTKPELIAAYDRLRAQVEPHLPRLFKRLPRAPYEIRAVEEFRERSAASQYWPASPDGTRPGIFYVNAAKIAEKPLAPIESLFIHEAAPGHHFEISLRQEQTDQPRFRRFGGFTAFSEGWGLYCEGLGPDLGCYRQPQQKMGWLSADMWRARRLVVDVGLHVKGWSREEARQYLLDNPYSRMSADLEVDRYIARPGQALAYKVGERIFTRLRDEARRQLGDRFDIREFHDALLSEGALPLTMLEKRLQAWAAHGGKL